MVFQWFWWVECLIVWKKSHPKTDKNEVETRLACVMDFRSFFDRFWIDFRTQNRSRINQKTKLESDANKNGFRKRKNVGEWNRVVATGAGKVTQRPPKWLPKWSQNLKKTSQKSSEKSIPIFIALGSLGSGKVSLSQIPKFPCSKGRH